MIKAMEDLQGLDADAVARAIEADAGQAIPGLRESLADLKAGKYGVVYTPASIAARAKGKRRCDLAESCGLQALSPEVARATPEVREAFESGLKEVSAAILSGPKSPKAPRDEAAACSALAALVGAVTLARAVGSEQFGDAIAASAGVALLGELWQPK